MLNNSLLCAISGLTILYIVLGGAAAAYIALFTIKVVIKKKRNKIQKEKVESNLDEKDNVRYTMEENPVAKDGVNENTGTSVNVTFKEKDKVLYQHTPVTVGPDSEIKPGKYILLSTDENVQTFNVRVGIYVREYKHNQEIVLADGDTICAVSCNVILR